MSSGIGDLAEDAASEPIAEVVYSLGIAVDRVSAESVVPSQQSFGGNDHWERLSLQHCGLLGLRLFRPACVRFRLRLPEPSGLLPARRTSRHTKAQAVAAVLRGVPVAVARLAAPGVARRRSCCFGRRLSVRPPRWRPGHVGTWAGIAKSVASCRGRGVPRAPRPQPRMI